ncbi:aminoacyl-histidine dipeptidase [Chitinimonas lacunae]|uniref:Aminoacyl-histidine dipeptidase n=1 Tax=Chitinimonas lacunae TaxID=1963018 RepID=A0ABV8MQ94_9NEIS
MTFPLPNANPVWPHFQALCAIPRPSKHESRLRDHLCSWARARELHHEVDAAGNLLIRKAASPGKENCPGVALQGHLDMVCQQNEGTGHDFHRDPIRPVIEDGWLVARDTTLGADNGIGVALALAVLDSRELRHGPLEVLFTVDEEAGMGGARGLAPGWLQSAMLINLDTEEWGSFYLGAAGGVDVVASRGYAEEAIPAGHEVLRLSVSGLVGGHSGGDIHLERGNAIKLLARVLERLGHDWRLARLQGGTARNALPREAWAVVSLPAAAISTVRADIAAIETEFREELAGVDGGVTVRLEPDCADQVLVAADQATLLNLLRALPHGVHRMSRRVEGVVETSNNLGVARLAEGRFDATLMVRSLLASGTTALSGQIVSILKLAGASAELRGAYPGWAPDPDSRLLTLMREVYRREFAAEPEIRVIHAGLECGLLATKYPHLQMVSYGPDIRGAHAPGERVEIASVDRCWQLLTATLAAIS